MIKLNEILCNQGSIVTWQRWRWGYLESIEVIEDGLG